MRQPSALYKRHRFPGEIINHAVWLYHRFLLSYRDVEELLAQRGITVSATRPRRITRGASPERQVKPEEEAVEHERRGRRAQGESQPQHGPRRGQDCH